MSESDAPSDAAVPAPTPAQPESAAAPETPASSPWARVSEWKLQGVTREDMKQRLTSEGLSSEDIGTLLNALDGTKPPDVPEMMLAPGINPLAPSMFSIFELGIQGAQHVVGQYWMAFGGLTAAAMVFFNILWMAEIFEEPTPLTVVMSRLALIGAALAFIFGAFKYVTAFRVRRKG